MRGLEQIPWLYDALCSATEWMGLGKWRDWLVSGARGAVLEVGCGTGRNLPRYRSPPVAIDPDAEALRKARTRRPDAHLVRASAEALPFRDAAFDTVVSSLVFCSVPSPERGLAEIARVLRSDGELRMLEHVRASSRLGAQVQDWIQPAWTKLAGGCFPNRPTESTVEASGFEVDPAARRVSGTMRRFAARKRRG